MPKISVKSHLLSNNSSHITNSKGLMQKDKIIYYENDIKVTFILSENVITLLRETNEYELVLRFEENKVTNGRQKMKKFPMELEAEITTSLLEKTDSFIKIDYHLILAGEEIGDFTFLLEYEVS